MSFQSRAARNLRISKYESASGKNARKQHALRGRRCTVPIVATKEKEYHEIRVQNLSKENENYTPLQSRCLYL